MFNIFGHIPNGLLRYDVFVLKFKSLIIDFLYLND